MKRYYDYEHDQIVHEADLYKEFMQSLDDKGVSSISSAETPEDYIENCQTYNGGTLMLIQGMDDNDNLTDVNVPDTGWLHRDLAFILTREQMHKVYIDMQKIAEFDNFASFLDDVVAEGIYRRVI